MTYKPRKLGHTDLVFWFMIRVRQSVFAPRTASLYLRSISVSICAILVNTQTQRHTRRQTNRFWSATLIARQPVDLGKSRENWVDAPQHVVHGKQKTTLLRSLSSSYQQCELRRKYTDYFRRRRIDTRRVVDDVSSLAVTWSPDSRRKWRHAHQRQEVFGTYIHPRQLRNYPVKHSLTLIRRYSIL